MAGDMKSRAAQTSVTDAPGAATLFYRRLVTAVLDRATSKYYPYAARDLAAASALADRIMEDPSLEPHGVWMEELRRLHGRKTGFWSLVQSERPRGVR